MAGRMPAKCDEQCGLGKADKPLSRGYRGASTGSFAMTGVTLSSADLDPRRRRILFRCWHRGIREMDLVFGQFAERELSGLSEAELDEFETIMAEEDNDLVRWIMGTWPVPERFHTPMFERLCAYKPDFEYPADTLPRNA
jgi:antitoxin CptB